MNYIKDVQSTPTTCAASFLDELEKHIFLYFSECVTSHYCQTPSPLKMMSQTVTILERPLTIHYIILPYIILFNLHYIILSPLYYLTSIILFNLHYII